MSAIKGLGIGIVTIFAPIQAALIVALCLVVADLITGVIAAKKQKEAITSSGIKRTVGKIVLYELAICLAFLCQQYLTGDLFPASKLVTALVGLTELTSILENLNAIHGAPVFKIILDKITKSKENLEK